MADAFLQGIQIASDNQAQVRNDITVIAINWYINRCPLVTRVPRVPVGSQEFTMVSRTYRPRTVTVSGSHSNSTTTLTLTDASTLMVGDVLETVLGERIQVTA